MDDQIGQAVEDILRTQPAGHPRREAFAGNFIHDHKGADRPPVVGSFEDEVVVG